MQQKVFDNLLELMFSLKKLKNSLQSWAAASCYQRLIILTSSGTNICVGIETCFDWFSKLKIYQLNKGLKENESFKEE